MPRKNRFAPPGYWISGPTGFRGHPPASPEFGQDAASMALIEGEIVNCVISPQRGKDPYAKFFLRRNWKTGLWSKAVVEEDVLDRLAQ